MNIPGAGALLLLMILAGSCGSPGGEAPSSSSGDDGDDGDGALQVVILGPPGAGKGTQAKKIAEGHGIPHISTGDILRAEVEKGTGIGREVEAVMQRGDLVEDRIVLELVEKRLGEPDTEDGFILDGFPRTLPQAEGLDAILETRGTPALTVIYLDVPAEVLTERLLGRARADDTRETIRNRIEVYHEETAPLIDHYRKRGGLVRIDGDQSIEDVFADIESALRAD